jgi:hypothetical protein
MYPPPHMTHMYPPPHMTHMYPPPHMTHMYPPPHMTHSVPAAAQKEEGEDREFFRNDPCFCARVHCAATRPLFRW